ncbi:MAG: DNA-directed RNA polymerase subunit omega [Clostridiales bacterium]|nr:MAG: DNA-directed RNA polymerase subunit omega [Clostridiales bacterium]
MIKPSIDEMLEISGSRYTLIVATAKRAKEILGANKENDSGNLQEIDMSLDDFEKPVTRAIKDIYNGEYEIVNTEESI